MAAMLLKDLVFEIDNPWSQFYDATRATPFITPEGLKQNLDVGTHWVGDRIKGFADSLNDVAHNQGQVVQVDGQKVAAYRNENGAVHAVSAICSHLGCVVAWNNAEKSWDCPCHGARFNCEGKVLHGPAVNDLEQIST